MLEFLPNQKNTGQEQLPAPTHNFNSQRANCGNIHKTEIVASAVPDDNQPYLIQEQITGTDQKKYCTNSET